MSEWTMQYLNEPRYRLKAKPGDQLELDFKDPTIDGSDILKHALNIGDEWISDPTYVKGALYEVLAQYTRNVGLADIVNRTTLSTRTYSR